MGKFSESHERMLRVHLGTMCLAVVTKQDDDLREAANQTVAYVKKLVDDAAGIRPAPDTDGGKGQ